MRGVGDVDRAFSGDSAALVETRGSAADDHKSDEGDNTPQPLFMDFS